MTQRKSSYYKNKTRRERNRAVVRSQQNEENGEAVERLWPGEANQVSSNGMRRRAKLSGGTKAVLGRGTRAIEFTDSMSLELG